MPIHWWLSNHLPYCFMVCRRFQHTIFTSQWRLFIRGTLKGLFIGGWEVGRPLCLSVSLASSSPYSSTDGGYDSCIPVHLLGASVVTSPDEEEENTEDDKEEDGNDERHDDTDRHGVVTAA